ncbi:MAG: TetR/AcrR family transcriptional regulator [Actinobacteria bacterium]|nr:TetR/AcrR family transcriptional regulator [Actinomycetota bacterium]
MSADRSAGDRGAVTQGAHAELLQILPVTVLRMEARGVVTRTFRRLDPERQLAAITAILVEAAETGPGELSMRAVAQRAGVALGSLYQYFPDRQGMVTAAAEIAGGLLAGDLARYRDDLASLPLREALVLYVSAGVEWSVARPGLLRFFGRAAYGNDPALSAAIVAPVVDELLAMVRAIIEAAVARGEIPPPADLEAAVRFIHGSSIVLSDSQLLPNLDEYFRQLQGASLQQRAEEMAGFVVAALGGRDASPAGPETAPAGPEAALGGRAGPLDGKE